MTNKRRPSLQNIGPKEPDSITASLGEVNFEPGSVTPLSSTLFQSHFGPLPPASELDAYSRIQPDLVDRIVSMAEANAASEREQAKNEQRNYFWLNLIGRLFGFMFALVSLGATVWLCRNGHDVVGGAIGSAAVAGTAAALITGKVIKSGEAD